MVEYETEVAEISNPGKKTIEVLTGEVKLGIAGSILQSKSIGSCVVIAAYDSKKKLGAMAHFMHHGISAKDNVYERKTLYAHDAINALLIDIGRAGSTVADIEVCLAGGANVLTGDHDTIGKDNIDSVIKLLSEKAINVAAQSLGGTERRSVFLDCETGTVTCALGNEKEKILWKAVERKNGFSRVESCGSAKKPDDEELQKINKEVDVSKGGPAMDSVEGDRKRIIELENSQRACLNIMQDLEKKKREMEDVQNAYLNIVQDLEKKNKEHEQTQQLLLRVMEDLKEAKKETDLLNSTLEEKVEEATRALKESTLQLIQSEKLSALGELTASVAHELKQPLNTIKIIGQSILRDIDKKRFDEQNAKEDLPEIIHQVDRMSEIIDHMRVFTRRSIEGASEIVDLNAVIGDALKFVAQQLRDHNIEIFKDLEVGLPKVSGDSIRLEQVVVNLIGNARFAVGLNGKAEKRIEVRTGKGADGLSVWLEVGDNGSGITEDAKKKIFQPFFTTKEPGKGTGLGLSVSRKIIEEHKGTMAFESNVGEGATFRFELPAAS